MSELTEHSSATVVRKRPSAADRAFESILGEIEIRIAPAEEQYESRPPRDVLRDNFRASFKLSNGSARLQFLYYVRLTDILRVTYDHQTISSTAQETVDDTPPIVVPFRHAAPTPTPYDTRAKNIWVACMEVVKYRDNLSDISPSEELDDEGIEDLQACADIGEIMLSIPEHLMQRDLYYIKSQDGRPNRTDTASRYRSLTRDYAVLNKPSGTPEFDFTMQEAGAVIKTLANPKRKIPSSLTTFSKTTNAIRRLAAAWEQHHDEPFFPAKIFESKTTK